MGALNDQHHRSNDRHLVRSAEHRRARLGLAGVTLARDDGIKGTYRFRYYRGDQSLQFEDSQDVKHWVELDLCKYTEEKTIHVMRVMAESLADLSGGEKWELMMGTGTVTQFMDEYKKLPFVTFKVEPA